MSRLTLDKSTLARKQTDLALYERFLPSLELKRRQLLASERIARSEVEALAADLTRVRADAERVVPFLGWRPLDLGDLVRLARVEVVEENVVGVRLPLIAVLEVERGPYSFFARPHWVDPLVEALEQIVRLTVALRVAEERALRLRGALDTTTRRVNLFEKVLIPRTRAEIRRIRLFLADAERAAVVRSKLAKQRREASP